MIHEFDPRDLEPSLGEPPPSRRVMPLALAGGAMLLFIGVGWYAYTGSGRGAGEIPIIRADATPVKARPDAPGGLETPYQTEEVLNSMAREGRATSGGEKLSPPPEQPVPPPGAREPAPSVLAAATPVVPQAKPTQLAPIINAPAFTAPSAPTPTTTPSTAPTVAPVTTQKAQAPVPGSQTASLATPPAAKPVLRAEPKPVTPVATNTAGATRIQLAAMKTSELADQEWARLQKRYPELVGLKLTKSRVEIADKGVFFRVQAGPFADAAAAERVCAALKGKNQGCALVR